MAQGWISIHRKIRDCAVIWDDKPFSRGQAWLDLLLMVNHEDKEIMFNGCYRKIERGQTLTSLTKLSDQWGWSRKKTTKFLNELKMAQMLDLKSDNKSTTVTVINYDFYQDVGAAKEPQKNRKRTSEEHQRNTNNNELIMINNTNNNSLSRESKKFIPPTEEEVETYCQSRGNGISGAEFVNFYASKGWLVGKSPMKDWKRAVMTWESKRGFKYNPDKKGDTQWQ